MSAGRFTAGEIFAKYAAGEISADDYTTWSTILIKEQHAAKYPDGCPGGMCEDCFKRLGGVREKCLVCGLLMPVVRGKFLSHQGRVSGRPGYSARHFRQFAGDCAGSGRKV